MKKIFERIKLFLGELLNLITNILVPIMSVIIAIVELFPVPTKVIDILKKAEYWLFYSAGTGKKIEKIMDENAKKLEEEQKEKEDDSEEE